MTIYEKLIGEFSCAINAIYGDQADNEANESNITNDDIDAIAKKVKFYISK